MNRADVIDALEAYFPKAEMLAEKAHVLKTIDFIRRTPEAFERDHEALGHVTAGGLVVSTDLRHVLLNHHTQAGIFMNFGGHCDGDEDIFATAKKEVTEESGITTATCDRIIFDVDIHAIPPHTRQGVEVPWHLHYDINFLVIVPHDVEFSVSEESVELKWFTLDEALMLQTKLVNKNFQLQRMFQKVRALQLQAT